MDTQQYFETEKGYLPHFESLFKPGGTQHISHFIGHYGLLLTYLQKVTNTTSQHHFTSLPRNCIISHHSHEKNKRMMPGIVVYTYNLNYIGGQSRRMKVQGQTCRVGEKHKMLSQKTSLVGGQCL
jgi:hypothetical protein